MALINKLKLLGDSIRERTGKTKQFSLEEMAQEIKDIPKGIELTDIAKRTFGGELIMNSEDNIKDYAFAYSQISKIYADSLNVGPYACYNCGNLTEVILPKCKNIDNHGFAGCIKLSKVELPECQQVGEYGFYNCNQLEEIRLPKVTSASLYIFSNTKRIYLPSLSTNSTYLCVTGAELVDLKQLTGTTNDTSSATLRGCFPNSIKYIGFQNLINGFHQTSTSNSIFYNNSELINNNVYMVMDMATPPVLSSIVGTFRNQDNANKMVICVPANAIENWQTAENWNQLNIQSIESLENELKGKFDWLDEKYWPKGE